MSERQKIIFLDIDGVLNHHTFLVGTDRKFLRSDAHFGKLVRDNLTPEFVYENYLYRSPHSPDKDILGHVIHDLAQLDPTACGIIQRLVLDHNAQIVVSSVWRLDAYPKYFEYLFDAVGCPLPEGTVIGKTDNLNLTFRERGRGQEVNKYIKDNNLEDALHVIIDDDSDFFDDQPLVRTAHETGLTYNEYQVIDEYFKTGVIKMATCHIYRLKRMLHENANLKKFIVWKIDGQGSEAVFCSGIYPTDTMWIKRTGFAELRQLGCDTIFDATWEAVHVYVEYDNNAKVLSYELL